LAALSVATDVNFEWLATGRGMRRLDSAEVAPALLLKFSAQCGLEERLLLAFRRLRNREQMALLGFMETLPDGRRRDDNDSIHDDEGDRSLDRPRTISR
jgi:hypothetical protein